MNTRAIDRTGGTVLHTSRTNPARMPKRHACRPSRPTGGRADRSATDVYDLTPVVLANIEHLGLDGLVTIGGDDTLSFAESSPGMACH